MVYKDDMKSQKYEILRNPLGDNKSYLAFSLIAIVQAHAYDEAILFENKQVVLRIISDSLDSFSEVDSFNTSMLWTTIILLSFLGVLIKLILPSEVYEPVLAQIGMQSSQINSTKIRSAQKLV